MTPFQRDYTVSPTMFQSTHRHGPTYAHARLPAGEDNEAAYDEPFPYHPYIPEHVVIDIGDAIAAGAVSARSCYDEICRDMAAIVQIFLWACVVHCQTFTQFILWCLVSISAYKALSSVGNTRQHVIRSEE